jgi:hypothetical protein
MALEPFISGTYTAGEDLIRNVARGTDIAKDFLAESIYRARVYITAVAESHTLAIDSDGVIGHKPGSMMEKYSCHLFDSSLFNPMLFVEGTNLSYMHAVRVYPGDVATYTATGRRFTVTQTDPRLTMKDVVTGGEVAVRTIKGFVCEQAVERAKTAVIIYSNGRPELWEMVYDHPHTERPFRWLVFCDYLQDGHWGEEWAARAEAMRTFLEETGGRG